MAIGLFLHIVISEEFGGLEQWYGWKWNERKWNEWSAIWMQRGACK